MILLIDNYDSFSYNLYQFLGMNEPDIKVIRNDEMTVEQIEALIRAAVLQMFGNAVFGADDKFFAVGFNGKVDDTAGRANIIRLCRNRRNTFGMY